MPIEASAPITATEEKLVPETETKTYNAWWITGLHIESSPTGTKLHAVLRPWNTETNEISDKKDLQRALNIDDLTAQIAAGDTQLGAVFTAVIAEIERQAREKGVI